MQNFTTEQLEWVRKQKGFINGDLDTITVSRREEENGTKYTSSSK